MILYTFYNLKFPLFHLSRTTATNLNMMFIRIGIFSGNMAMPYLLKTGCLPTILFISTAIFGKILLLVN